MKGAEDRITEQEKKDRHSGEDVDSEHELSSEGEGGGANGSALASAKLSTKKKEALSQVPCKFFRSNGCSAGSSCPFAHILPGEGQGKAVCQWFLKGSCRFGHKCALAHILPGQPMSMDRKNKRAAQHHQQSLPSHAAGEGGSQQLPQNRQGGQEQLRHFQPRSGLRQQASIGRSGDMDSGLHRAMEEGNVQQQQHQQQLQQYQHTNNQAHQPRDGDLVFGLPDDLNVTAAGPSQILTAGNQMRDSRSEWRSRMTAQGIETDFSARRSHDSALESRNRVGLAGSPVSTQAFGTSPFSNPGSQSVFYSNGYNLDHRADDGRGPIKEVSRILNTSEGEETDKQEINEEDFLPSSLSDLLTPAELQRRSRSGLSALGSMGATTSLAPQSMPARTLSSSSLWDRPATDRQRWHQSILARDGEEEGTFVRATHLQDVHGARAVSAAVAPPATMLVPLSSTFGASNTSAGFLTSRIRQALNVGGPDRGIGETDLHKPRPFDAYSPGAQAVLTHAPGQSLPQGLAAGLSRLHLRSEGTVDPDEARRSLLPNDSGPTASTIIWNSQNSNGFFAGAAKMHDDLGPTAPSSIFAHKTPLHLAMASRSTAAAGRGGVSASTSFDAQPHSSFPGGHLSSSINGNNHGQTLSPYARSPAIRVEGSIAIPSGSNATALSTNKDHSSSSAAAVVGGSSLSGSHGSLNSMHTGKTPGAHPGFHRVRTAGVTGTGSPLALPTTGEEVEEPMFELE